MKLKSYRLPIYFVFILITLLLFFSSAAILAMTDLTGDINTDGKVNVLDFSILVLDFGTDQKRSDLNNSGTVDFGDLFLMFGDWNKIETGISSLAACTIESFYFTEYSPGTMLLVARLADACSGTGNLSFEAESGFWFTGYGNPLPDETFGYPYIREVVWHNVAVGEYYALVDISGTSAVAGASLVVDEVVVDTAAATWPATTTPTQTPTPTPTPSSNCFFDQKQESYAGGFSSPVTGQSFTPAVTANLISIDFCANPAGNYSGQIREGEDANGNLLAASIEVINTDELCTTGYNKWIRLRFNPTLLAAGNIYTVVIRQTEGMYTLGMDSLDSYPGGKACYGDPICVFQPDKDCMFRTYVCPP